MNGSRVMKWGRNLLKSIAANRTPAENETTCLDTAALYDRGMQAPVGAFFEQVITGIYSRLVLPGSHVIDCGANWGLHTEPLSRLVGDQGRVWAIEALPERARALQHHLAANGFANVTIVPKAIADRAGTAEFLWVRDAEAYSGLQERRGIPTHALGSASRITVPVCTLDDLTEAVTDPIRFIKMDLEGGEYDALRGATRLLRRDGPVVIFESGRQEAADVYGYTREAWFDFFESHHYAVTDLFGQPFDPSLWFKENIPWYFIAAPRESVVAQALKRIVPAAIREIVPG